MSRREIIAGLDIGTSEVKVVIGEFDPENERVNIIGYSQVASSGIDKSDIIDIDDVARSIREATEYAERMAGVEVEGFYVGLPVQHVTLIYNSGAVAVSGNERIVQEEDVERVLHAAKVVAIPPENKIIDIIPCQFKIDNKTGVQRPVGMAGVRLEVDALLISLNRSVEQNITRCIEEAGYGLFQFVLNPLACSYQVLREDEKEVGVMLLDIGGGTTELSYFNKGVLLETVSIPIGGNLITQDLASVLKIPQRQAEALKIRFGDLMSEEDEDIDLELETGSLGFDGQETLSSKLVRDVISYRLAEIFDMVIDEIIRMGFKEPPPAGIKVLGGVTKMSGFADFATESLFTKVRIANNGRDDQTYIIAKGIINYIHQYSYGYIEYDDRDRSSSRKRTGFMSWLKEFFEAE